MRRIFWFAVLLIGCAETEPLTDDAAPTPDRAPSEDVRDALPRFDVSAVDAMGGIDAMAEDASATTDGMVAADAEAEADAFLAADAALAMCEDLTPCGPECVDLQADAHHCGRCGRTCVMPHAMARCAEGECVVGVCEAGWFDNDGSGDNGCELQSDCQPGAPCASDCGSEGITECVDGQAACAVPAEICDGIDDDCDGACDEGPLDGCRVPIHRAQGNGHLFTDDLAQAQAAPFHVEAEAYFRLYAEEHQGMRAVFLCRKPDGKFFLTTHTACEIERAPERTLGYWSPNPLCGSTPLYRVYHAPSNNHFYTISAPERDNAINNLGYRDEGIAGHVWRNP